MRNIEQGLPQDIVNCLPTLAPSKGAKPEAAEGYNDKLIHSEGEEKFSPKDFEAMKQNRTSYFDEMNQKKRFECRNLFKRHSSEDLGKDVVRYQEQFETDKARSELNDDMFSELQALFNEKVDVDGEAKPKSRMNDAPLSVGARQPKGYQAPASTQNYGKSSKDFCEEIAEIIGETKEDYLQIYEKVLEKYITLFKSLSDILSELPKLISDGKDNKVTVNAAKLKELLQALKDKYKNEQLYPTDPKKKASEAEAKDWAEKLGLPASCVQQKDGGGYIVTFDLSPIDEMIKGLDAVGGEISSAKYQAWKAGFDAQVEKINNYVQTLSQKYTTANSTYDNLVKVLSSTITSMYDADKEFLKN